MKIRIKGNSLRIRLSKSEVNLLATAGYIEERTDFVNKTLFYAVESTTGDTMTADFNGEKVIMYIPENLLKEWAFSDQVSLEHQMDINKNHALQMLLEKDFKCIDADSNEDQSDYFENPLKSC
jgi:hypothetical protein